MPPSAEPVCERNGCSLDITRTFGSMPDSFNCSMSGECISPSAADRPAAPAPTITASYISSTCFGLISKIVAQGLTFAAHVTGARRIIPFMEEISDNTATPGNTTTPGNAATSNGTASSGSTASFNSATSFNSAVYDIVRRIPRGAVATYGQVATLAGRPRNARFVGFALHANPEPGVIPCHRVVFRDGSLAPGFAFGGPERQRAMLEEEGVPFIPPRAGHDNAGDGGWRVDLARCQWQA